MKICSRCRQAIAPAYHAWCKQCKNTYHRNWRDENPDWMDGEPYQRHLTRVRTRRAIVTGVLTRHPCQQCGSEQSQAHHDDYSKPLEVTWLCRPCHLEHHRREKAGEHGMQVETAAARPPAPGLEPG